MKIAFVAHPGSRFRRGLPSSSVEIWVREVAIRLAHDHDVVVYAGRKGWRRIDETFDGVRYVKAAFPPDRGVGKILAVRRSAAPFSRANHFGYISRVARHLARDRFDAVVVMDFAQFARSIRARSPHSAITLFMNSEWLTRLGRSPVRSHLKCVDTVFGCSDHVTNLVSAGFPSLSCRTVGNGVDTEMFRPRSVPRSLDAGKTVLFVGRVSPEKGVHDLVESFASVAKTHGKARLEIVGNARQPLALTILETIADESVVAPLRRFYDESGRPRYHQFLEDRIRELGISDRVFFRGSVPYAEVPRLYEKALVVCNPSFSESFGRSLIEAMACGLPVVATRVGGMKEIVEDGVHGRLVEPGDVEGLSRALGYYLESPSLCDEHGSAGRRRVVERYTWDTIAERLARGLSVS